MQTVHFLFWAIGKRLWIRARLQRRSEPAGGASFETYSRDVYEGIYIQYPEEC